MSIQLSNLIRSKRPSRIKWVKENRIKLNEKMQEWREKNRERFRLYMRDYCRKNRDKINENQKTTRIKRLYGITLEQFETLLKNQGGGCAICGKEKKKYRLAIDHDHKTGRVRGILCSPCNRALGILGDSIDGLQKATQYLNQII